MKIREYFPDGTLIDDWFYEEETVSLADFENKYYLSEFGICSDGKIYTEEIQKIIDLAHQNGGGVVVVDGEKVMSGALFFKLGVSLCVLEGSMLKGSDDVCDYPIMETRIEGETCLYYPALINADCADGFKIFGGGTIDGNGERSWRAFWKRREWNPACTNKDEQRPRLVYVSNSKDVVIQNVTLQNSHFWTTHLYKCHHSKVLGCKIFAPREPVKSPSTDAFDIDACTDILIKKCRIQVNDDGIALKGGKGPYADELPENGANERIIIEECEFVYCHGCVTCGSEAIHNKNIILRRSKLLGPWLLLWLKLRPDTPQHYEYIRVEDVSGEVEMGLSIYCWTQFFDLKDRKDIPLSYANNIEFKNCDLKCKNYFDGERNDKFYLLSDFTFENVSIETKEDNFKEDVIKNFNMINTKVSVL